MNETDEKWKDEIKKKELEMQEITYKYDAVSKDLVRPLQTFRVHSINTSNN